MAEDELESFLKQSIPKLAVIGAGGSGSNTITHLTEMKIGVETIAANTDAQHLLKTKANNKVLLGKKKTKGLGAGSNPSVGEAAAQETENELREMISGFDLVFLTAGMGGGTGTGSLPVIAKAVKEAGALCVAIVTTPFNAEGKKRMENALTGIAKLEDKVDTLIVVPNERLLDYVPDLPLAAAFKIADSVLSNAVKGISELIIKPGLVNLDFADVRTVLEKGGNAMIGIGEISNDETKDRAVRAAEKALESPLLDLDFSNVSRALVNVSGGADLTLGEAQSAVSLIASRISGEAHLIWGATIDESFEKGEVKVLAVLAGINQVERPKKEERKEELELDFI
jgi:cell division protein FtsZ